MRKVNSVDLAGLNDFFDTAQMNMKNTKPKLNMDRDDIMHLVNECAPRYESWGCEAHFQLFAKRLMEREREACAKVFQLLVQKFIEREREACAKVCETLPSFRTNTCDHFAFAIRARGDA